MIHLDKRLALDKIIGAKNMALTSDGWFDWALRDPGPVGSVNGSRNGGKGVIPHSAEGSWDSLKHLHDFHWSRATDPDPRNRASWGATNLKDGRLVQHYSVWEQTWTSGSDYPNNNFFAFENEGGAGEPLTDAQTANTVRICRELGSAQGWTLRRPVDAQDKTATAYEHNECRRFGSAPTACPSGRVPWGEIMRQLEEDDVKSFLAWVPDYAGGSIWFVGPNGAKWITDAVVAAELERAFGKVAVTLSAKAINTIGA